MSNLSTLNDEALEMSSREIAELTGKRHDNVLRDIRNMLDEIQSPQKWSDYKDDRGRLQPMLLLNKEESLCLIAGYNVKLRMAIIKRWQELESQQAPQIQQTYADALLEAARLALAIEEKDKQLELAAPKVEFHDLVVSDNATFTRTQAAKKLAYMIKQSEKKKKKKMNNLSILNNEVLTMSSREIAELTQSRHDNVKRSMERMSSNGIISFTPMEESTVGGGKVATVYHVNKRNSYIVVAQLSPEFTAALVDRWQELESQQAPRLPQTFAEALQLAADQAKQLELAAPKVAFVDNLVERSGLMNAGQIAQKHGKSAIWLNKQLDELNVYNKAIKRGRVFQQWFIDQGLGQLKQTEQGYSQAMFTNAGEVWINERLTSEGLI